MKTLAFFEIPIDVKTKSTKGSSPKLLDKLIEQLQGAAEIKISFFLYNNPYLHKAIELLAVKGCHIIIYTIPLSGYDRRKKEITLPNGKKGHYSKYEYAEKIVQRVMNSKLPIELRYIPHTNVWYVQKTSRGLDSYALHSKSILIKNGDGSYKCISTSSNMALGDPPHSENLFITDRKKDIHMFHTYFDLLHKQSLSLKEYGEFCQQSYDFQYVTKPSDIQDEYGTCYFTAPFIKYNGAGSNHYVQNKIIEFMKTARQRLYFCFQHISDINSFDKQAQNIVSELGEIAGSNPSLDIKVIKQTRSNHQKQGDRTAKAEQFLKCFRNIEQKVLFPIIHDKFMIADNNLLVTTANLTSTQFAWAEDYEMRYQVGQEKYSILNTFSDINSFHFTHEHPVVNDYLSHFSQLWMIGDCL
ncbi:hypothetical protein [Cytobacillus massiliigabonensis]|uniref:hypothetical protein n=1 Tax=Cytobacillus massiliigabonensis TaxID=1871011 RepID=UPI000C815D3D|nr:hypothetical protein [Cytobacillus massiliigabonensis]